LLPDLPPRLVSGVTGRLIACRLGRREPLDGLVGEIDAWAALYESPVSEHRWSELAAPLPVGPSPFLPRRPLCAPPLVEIDDRSVPARASAEAEWLRIVFATVHVVHRDGLQSASVEEIARLAGVEARAFHAVFEGKQQALAAAQELLFRHLVAVAAGAFVTGETWSSRLWEAARALTQCAEQNAALTHVSLLHPCSAGAPGDRLPQDVTSAFAMFLREGELESERAPSRAPISDTGLGAIVTAIFELAVEHVQSEPPAPLTDLLARVVFLCTAPYLGPADAAALARKAA
jgi:AcrR family transcriptional regulator